MKKQIFYDNSEVIVMCDEKCHKAYGIQNRPKIQLSDHVDDVVYLADDELPHAPINPGTYEGGHAKPVNTLSIPNKWCVRECERCMMFDLNKEPRVNDYTSRVYNQPWKHIK